MWPVARPTISAKDSYETCISRVRNQALKDRLEAATPTVVEASRTFATSAQGHTLHTYPRSNGVNPDLTTAEMEKIYTQRMAKEGAPGRDIYDAIFESSQGRCPLCGQRLVTTVDHHLPKAHYPALVVAPLNLVPSCADCNKAKLALFPQSEEQVPLHPYYDNLGDEVYLFAEVLETEPASARFYITAPEGWDDLLEKRVRNHFRSLKLGALYAAEAAEELLNIRYQMTQILEAQGPDGVRDELQARAVSGGVGRSNGWRSAVYEAWHQNEWFCAGGFAVT